MAVQKLIPRKIYMEDLATGTGTEVVNVMGAGPVALTRISATALGGNAVQFLTEEPAGTKDGVNAAFTISRSTYARVQVFRDGIKMKEGKGYSIATNTITFLAGYIPEADTDLEVEIDYYS